MKRALQKAARGRRWRVGLVVLGPGPGRIGMEVRARISTRRDTMSEGSGPRIRSGAAGAVLIPMSSFSRTLGCSRHSTGGSTPSPGS